MKKLQYFLLAVIVLVSFISCQSNTKKYLIKKWDCVQVDNLAPIDKVFASKEDSAVAVKMEAALKSLSWTFNSNGTYQCSTMGGIVTVQGSYEISADEKTLTCTSISKNVTNTYLITAISEIEMTLTSTATTVPLVLHFRPS